MKNGSLLSSESSVVTMLRSGPIAILCLGAAGACGFGPGGGRLDGELSSPDPAGAEAVITSASLFDHISVLASDEFEGRAPGTAGEELTIAYLTSRFRALGLAPGNPNGTYTQDVPMVGFLSRPLLTIETAGVTIVPEYPSDFVAWAPRPSSDVRVEDSELVFVGYGVVAPEFGWDDYKDVDVTGKTLIMLYGDPPVPDSADGTRLDADIFRGKALTWYGMWDYKYDIAARKGAAAMVIVNDPQVSGIPWEAIASTYVGEQLATRSAGLEEGHASVESWITNELAKEIFARCGQNYDDAKRRALDKVFHPMSLGATADFRVRSSLREFTSHNVVAEVPGGRRELAGEHVIYTAHWDHLGRDDSLDGDQIFNGAVDNATGVAALLELAAAFSALDTAPDRSILFLATTAEERGSLGAKYYTDRPLHPLETTLAVINIDELNPWGMTKDVTVIGYGHSELDDLIARLAERQERVLAQDPAPQNGSFYRSDQLAFALKGVPAAYTLPGTDYIGKAAEHGGERALQWAERDYHQVTDEIQANWDLAGAVADLRLLFSLGLQIANGSAYPAWNPSSEFSTRREDLLNGVKGPARGESDSSRP